MFEKEKDKWKGKWIESLKGEKVVLDFESLSKTESGKRNAWKVIQLYFILCCVF